MLLDIKNIIKIQSPPYEITNIQKSIREGLTNHRVRVSVNPQDDILFEGYMGFAFWAWSEGRIEVKKDSENKIDISYHISSIIADIALILSVLLIPFGLVMRRFSRGLIIAFIIIPIYMIFTRKIMKRRFEYLVKTWLNK